MTGRRAFAAATALALAAALAGCSSLPFVSRTDEAAVATPENAVYALRFDAPDELRALLGYLDLARFQSAPGTDRITSVELDRLIAASPAQARTLLETEGYFNAEVHVTREAAADGSTLVRVAVQPGPRATIDKWSVEVDGALQEAVQAQNEDAVVELASLRRRWPLKAGQPFRQAAWTDAKNTTLARLRAEGYPAATWVRTSAHVDPQNHTVRLEVRADSGPLFRFGHITIEGLQRYDRAAARRLATFHRGQPYSEQLLLDYQERLLKTGLFEGAAIEIDPDPQKAEAAEVSVRVKEAPLQAATFGIGYSDNVGPRLTLEHVHRKVFGQRWIAKNKFELGPKLQSWEGELTSHALRGLYRNLVSGTIEKIETEGDEVRRSWNARVGRVQDTPRFERLYFVELTHARVETQGVAISDSDAASANWHWTLRDVDSLLLPTRGVTLATQFAGGLAHGREIDPDCVSAGVIGPDCVTDGRGPFGRAWGRLTWYKPLGNRWYSTLRTEAGQVFARDDVGVPDTLLFRAGGDDSVRGYAYRTLGPTVNDVVTSGRMLWTGSAEVAHPISPKYRQFWYAFFVDAGNAANRWSELDPAFGYGVGLRWRSPVGAMKLDLAYGQEVHKVRVHLSIGVAL